MKKNNRQQEILRLIQEKKCSRVEELSRAVFASPATVRRDLRVLCANGLIRLFYGGFAPLTDPREELPLALREQESKNSKQRIAQAAAKLIPAGASVFLDASSTAMYIADYLSPEKGITVFTNCLQTAMRLCERGVATYCLGGAVNHHSFVTSGALAEQNLSMTHVDMLFFSSQALDGDGVISDNSETESHLRRKMLEHARQSFFLCDKAKFGKRRLFSVCRASALTGVISDADLSFVKGIRAIQA